MTEKDPQELARVVKSYLLLAFSIFLLCMGLVMLYVVSGFFDSVSQSKEEWAARKELVASGQIDALEATVVSKRVEVTKTKRVGKNPTTDIDRDYWVVLDIDTVGRVPQGVVGKVYDSITEGQKVQVYPVDDVYVIPAFDFDDSLGLVIGKWIFFGFASLPILVGLIGLMLFFKGKRRQRTLL